MVELNHEIIGKSRMFMRNRSPWKDATNSIVREGDTGPYCPHCDSSLRLEWKWLWLRRAKDCIQPKCKNYQGSNRIMFGG